MKNRCKFQVAFVLAVALMASGALAQYQRIERPNVRFLRDVQVDGEAVLTTVDLNGGTIDGATIGASVASTATLASATLQGVDYFKATADAVEITSPSLVIDASDKGLIVLTSDESITGVTLSGGELYQVVTLVTGAGSNTIRFDDATSLTCGGNITVTEGDSDALTVMCTDATYGTIWTVLSTHDN